MEQWPPAEWKASYIPFCCQDLWCFTPPLIHETNPAEKKKPWSHTSHLSLLYARILLLRYWIGAHLHTLPWRYKFIEGIWYDISRNPTRTISSMKVSTTRNITHKLHVYDRGTKFNRRPVSRAARVLASYWAPCLNIIVLLRIHTPVKDHYWSNHPISSRWSLHWHTASYKAHLFIVSRRSTFIISCSDTRA